MLLEELEQDCINRHIPIIGRNKAEWLHNKILELEPKKILELGTANGYSGCVLGSEGAELTTIEIDPIIAEEAKQNFEEFDIDAKIIVGDGVEEIEKLAKDKSNLENFDLIFIDFANKKYIKVLENCIKLVKKKGIIISDNILREDCEEYKEEVLNHPRLKTEIIDIDNGMSYSQKI